MILAAWGGIGGVVLMVLCFLPMFAVVIDLTCWMIVSLLTLFLCVWFVPFFFTFASIFIIIVFAFVYVVVTLVLLAVICVGWLVCAIMTLIGQGKRDEMYPRVPLFAMLTDKIYDFLADHNIIKE